jgi:hypothetical protein
MTRDPLQPDELLPPACRPTVDRLQGVLDGDYHATALEADPHLVACAACRQRVAAARLLVSMLAAPTESRPASPRLADRILDAVRDDRRARSRRRVFAAAGGLAVAAAVALVVWLRWPADAGPDVANRDPGIQQPAVAPAPRPIRIGDEFSKAGLALLDAPRAITDSTAAAPQVIAKVTDAFTRGVPAIDVESPRTALAEIPDMARAGLEPVTGAAQKAFARFVRDVGTVQISAKPKS